MALIGVKPDNLRDSLVTRAQPLPSPGHRLSLVSGKPTLLLKGPSLDRIPSREKVSSRSQLFPKRVLLLKGPSLSGQLPKEGSFPAFEALFRKYGSALPAAIRRPQGGYYRKGSITEHAFRTAYKQFCKQIQLGKRNDSSQELGSRKSGGTSSSSFRGMEPCYTRCFCVGLGAGAPNTIQPQASAGPSNGQNARFKYRRVNNRR